jgi:hypothetical protein
MSNATVYTDELLMQLDETTDIFVSLITSVDENYFDVIPFDESWTIAQLASHVTKSNKAIVQALEMSGKQVTRDVDERVDELKKIFLNYETKFQSPEFILPTKNIYSKKEVIEKLQHSVNAIKELARKTDLFEVIRLPIFGEISKYELLYFVVFHTTRHIRQLKNILHILQPKN